MSVSVETVHPVSCDVTETVYTPPSVIFRFCIPALAAFTGNPVPGPFHVKFNTPLPGIELNACRLSASPTHSGVFVLMTGFVGDCFIVTGKLVAGDIQLFCMA